MLPFILSLFQHRGSFVFKQAVTRRKRLYLLAACSLHRAHQAHTTHGQPRCLNVNLGAYVLLRDLSGSMSKSPVTLLELYIFHRFSPSHNCIVSIRATEQREMPEIRCFAPGIMGSLGSVRHIEIPIPIGRIRPVSTTAGEIRSNASITILHVEMDYIVAPPIPTFLGYVS